MLRIIETNQMEEMMPYKIEKRGEKYCVINKDTGKSKGCSDSEREAIAHQRFLYGVEHGMTPRSEKKK